MKSSVYSRWDGTQDEFRLDAERALDALSNLMMEGLSAREALEWMREHGFELAGLDMRMMGLSELQDELRQQIRRTRADLRGKKQQINQRNHRAIAHECDERHKRHDGAIHRQEREQRNSSLRGCRAVLCCPMN